MKYLILTLALSLPYLGYSNPNPILIDSITGLAVDDPFVARIDSMLAKEYFLHDEYNYNPELKNRPVLAEEIPLVSDSVYQMRIEALNAKTPFDIQFNEDVLKYIKLYVKHRRNYTSICLGRSQQYFPMFEEKLDKHGMPLELKYLSIVESALNPTAKSPVGAKGLWQFMLPTGKMYGLDVDSYIDERCDPEKATEAACAYLKMLHGLYGDWSMALASYNAGPGNVNKAIRRSGGKMTYWEIRPFLPKETRNYVPAFIATAYMMEYASAHKIYSKKPARRIYELDTVQVSKPLYLQDISSALKIPYEELEFINPIYKTGYVPASAKARHIYLPRNKVGVFMQNMDTLYNWRVNGPRESFIAYESGEYHTVKRGEYLSLIANKHKVTVEEIRGWNNLDGNNIYPGQKLKIIKPVRKPIEGQKNKPKTPEAKQTSQTQNNSSNIEYEYYTIKSGDTLWDIANRKGVSLTHLKKLNPKVANGGLRRGQRIKIKEKR